MIHWIERDLARHIGVERPIYGLSFGLASDTGRGSVVMPGTIEDLAAHYISEMRALQREGPYYLIGHSAGGVVAYEMAQQLMQRGQQVALLGLLDTYAPAAPTRGGDLPLNQVIKNVLTHSPIKLAQYSISIAREKITKIAPVRKFLMHDSTLPAVLRLRLINSFINNYKPKPFGGKINFFKSMIPPATLRRAPPPPLELAWQTLAMGGFEIHEIPGDHMEIVKNPLAVMTAAKVLHSLADG
jgi:thioesterase domain-containing protein